MFIPDSTDKQIPLLLPTTLGINIYLMSDFHTKSDPKTPIETSWNTERETQLKNIPYKLIKIN